MDISVGFGGSYVRKNGLNILIGSDTSKVLSESWYPVGFNVNKLEFGTPYALSVTCDSSADGLWLQTRFNYWSTDEKLSSLSDTTAINCTKGKHVMTATIPSINRPDDFAYASFMIQAGDISGKGAIEISRPMLVTGETPQEWVPDYETIGRLVLDVNASM